MGVATDKVTETRALSALLSSVDACRVFGGRVCSISEVSGSTGGAFGVENPPTSISIDCQEIHLPQKFFRSPL